MGDLQCCNVWTLRCRCVVQACEHTYICSHACQLQQATDASVLHFGIKSIGFQAARCVGMLRSEVEAYTLAVSFPDVSPVCVSCNLFKYEANTAPCLRQCVSKQAVYMTTTLFLHSIVFASQLVYCGFAQLVTGARYPIHINPSHSRSDNQSSICAGGTARPHFMATFEGRIGWKC
jgi:hypothetical protein